MLLHFLLCKIVVTSNQIPMDYEPKTYIPENNRNILEIQLLACEKKTITFEGLIRHYFAEASFIGQILTI